MAKNPDKEINRRRREVRDALIREGGKGLILLLMAGERLPDTKPALP